MEVAIIVPMAFFLFSGVVLWKYFETRHKERMAIIERGENPLENSKKSWWIFHNPLNNLKWGILALGIGLGVFIGLQLSELYRWNDDFISAFILIFGGCALIIFYFIADKKMKDEYNTD